MRTATALWWIQPEVVLALDGLLGPPVDAYVNGSQTWFSDEERTIEWRLHPVGGYRSPGSLSHYDLFESVVDQLVTGADPTQLKLGNQTRALSDIWDGLEAFPAFGDEFEPATLVRRTIELIGIAPDISGLVDHAPIGEEWERTGRKASIVQLLAAQLQS
ncbi:MAG: hypothetical protein EXQ69_02650 [Acidimicrobiia bacterium]|nr:hypothetical protein [Acidimicrobiia bacterium]